MMKKTKENQITLKDNKTYFGIPFQMTGRHINLQKYINYQHSPGWAVDSSKMEEWYFTGIIQKDEQHYIYGKDFEGVSLNDILSYPLNKALVYFKQLVNALITLKQNNKELPVIQLDNVYFLENGSVLFLPSDIFDKIKSIDHHYNFKNYALVNNPYLNTDSEKLSYSLFIILYRLLSGIFPFDDHYEDELNNKIRNLKILPPKLINHKIKKEVSDYTASLFKKNHFRDLDLADWKKYIEKIIKHGVTEETTHIDSVKYKNEFKKQKKRLQDHYKNKMFWEKNHKKIFILSASIILIGFITFFLIKNFFRPRVTIGLSPREVLVTFYTSINKLDHITMEDCVINQAGKSDINEVISFFLNQKQSVAYTGQSTLTFADKWDKNGRPKIGPPSYVYGILNLNINKETSNGTKTTYMVSYEKWGPIINEDEKAEKRVQFQGHKIKDRVTIVKYKKYWVINEINRLEKISVDQ
jgi:hypothetical protein